MLHACRQQTATATSHRRAQLHWLLCLQALPQLYRLRSLLPLVFRVGMRGSCFCGELKLCLVPAALLPCILLKAAPDDRGQSGTRQSQDTPLNCAFLLHPSDNRNLCFSVQYLTFMLIPSCSGLLVSREQRLHWM